LSHKVGHSDLFLDVNQALLPVVDLCMQDHKSVCAAITVCSTLVNIRTHTDSFLISLFDKLSQLQPPVREILTRP